MLRITTEQLFDGSKKYIEGYALSTDTKPATGIITGSCIIEVDTGDVYLFNEASTAWVKQ